MLVALSFRGCYVSSELRFEGLGEHLAGSQASDLVRSSTSRSSRALWLRCMLRLGVSFLPTLARGLFYSIRREGTLRFSDNPRSTTLGYISRHSHRILPSAGESLLPLVAFVTLALDATELLALRRISRRLR